MRDLTELFREHIRRLPTKELDDLDADTPATKAVFSADNLPVPPTRVSTPDLRILRGSHAYPSWRVDELHLYARPDHYQALGLCILATLVMPQPEDVTVELTHPGTEVRKLVIRPFLTSMPRDVTQVGGWPTGYIARPHAFVYQPERLAYAPLSSSFGRCLVPHPVVHLVSDGSNVNDCDDQRDTLIGFGTDEAAAYLAGLLLNVGQPWQPHKEYSLESVAGYGGVGPGSAELRLWIESGSQ